MIKKNFILYSIGLVLITLLSCDRPLAMEQETTDALHRTRSDIGISFIIVGDWGRDGQHHQDRVAYQMNEAARILDPVAIISTGDNFYEAGVTSVDDPQWQSSFERIYTGESLQRDWYAILGNHDYRGDPDAQVAYTEKSPRWNMPARYYHKDFMLDSSKGEHVRLVFLDTSPFDLPYYTDHRYKNVSGVDTLAQKVWLDSILAASDAVLNIVVGHHPFYTCGRRAAETITVRHSLESIVEQARVFAYIAGHEHDLQHLAPKGTDVMHFISGAGSKVRPTGSCDEALFTKSISGFMTLTITPSMVTVHFIDHNGGMPYTWSQQYEPSQNLSHQLKK